MMTTKEYFDTKIPELIANSPDKLKAINGTFQFKIEGAGEWAVNCKELTVTEGTVEGADTILEITSEDFEAILAKKLNPMMAFTTRKLKVTGNLPLSLKLQTIL